MLKKEIPSFIHLYHPPLTHLANHVIAFKHQSTIPNDKAFSEKNEFLSTEMFYLGGKIDVKQRIKAFQNSQRRCDGAIAQSQVRKFSKVHDLKFELQLSNQTFPIEFIKTQINERAEINELITG